MKRYLQYCESIAADGIIDWSLGDWFHVSENRMTPRTLTSSAYYYVDCKIFSKIAKILGYESDAARYSALTEEIRNAINKHFYNGNGQYASGEQITQACALYQDIADHSSRDLVGAGLLESIKNTEERLEIGILGAKYLLRALSDIGETELAYKLLTQTDFPSWGYWLTLGATTLWETLNGDASQNHIMFGDINAWMFSYLAGIAPDDTAPGFKEFHIKPKPVNGLTWVRAVHIPPYGEIRSEWRRSNEKFFLDITVPANTTASVDT